MITAATASQRCNPGPWGTCPVDVFDQCHGPDCGLGIGDVRLLHCRRHETGGVGVRIRVTASMIALSSRSRGHMGYGTPSACSQSDIRRAYSWPGRDPYEPWAQRLPTPLEPEQCAFEREPQSFFSRPKMLV